MKENKPSEQPGSLQGGGYEAEDVFAGAEPWVEAETKLVMWSFISALVGLVIFATLIHIYILP